MKNVSERIRVEGHIIDSLTLSKVLDRIMELGGQFVIEKVQVGQRQEETSSAVLKVSAETQVVLDGIIRRLRDLGAEVLDQGDARLARAPKDGVFPERFYATTNLETWVRGQGRWIKVDHAEMDCGIRVDLRRRLAEAVRFAAVKRGEWFVIGHQGVKVTPLQRPRETEVFEFMTSEASTEKPKIALIHKIAREIKRIRAGRRGKILLVAGPAVVHAGAREDLAWLIAHGYVDVLFAGNALATHDLEAAMFGTSLGLSLKSGGITHGGHEHHLRAINRVRGVGSIQKAIQKGWIRDGICYSLVKHKVPFVLAGSIRDDGPLPETITDVMKAQEVMRRHLPGVQLALLLATTLHAVATGNLLPGSVRTVCVDMNPSSVVKLNDRGTLQSVGFVTDVGYFLRELRRALALGT
ncbi:MAG: TIGR00300 family protein [Elusimicrobia bacterium]|nr:TIGR00300 family protein [Elusimicrobiota bacterium]